MAAGVALLDKPWPRKTQCAKCRDVDPRVDARCVVVLMPWQLPDLRERCTGAEKLRCNAVVEEVCPLMSATADRGSLESHLGNHRNSTTRCEANVGRKCADKQPATR